MDEPIASADHLPVIVLFHNSNWQIHEYLVQLQKCCLKLCSCLLILTWGWSIVSFSYLKTLEKIWVPSDEFWNGRQSCYGGHPESHQKCQALSIGIVFWTNCQRSGHSSLSIWIGYCRQELVSALFCLILSWNRSLRQEVGEVMKGQQVAR